ncbi:MAG: flavodoxin-dependent (E)-4-hydroxy-3-methylbut-2-enyl-diphosphate synthase [Clostridia bacterium]|nr:flavodoxin-dependent (E)-4-hydroxy-3-methylbut-2-enyl-diphosphate synthase [Clostridia bacterium]
MSSKKHIKAGNVLIGGGAPISVQSMTNTDTRDIDATVTQINRLAARGCDIVRLAILDMEAAEAFGQIKRRVALPLVADIHFDYRLAVRCAREGADKIRINPGNIGSKERVRAVVEECGERGIPIRIGVNGGSLRDKSAPVTADTLCESALEHISILEDENFSDIAISLKASDVKTTIAAYRKIAGLVPYPLHVGVTEAGTEYEGVIKSAIGIGSLLADNIGDTIRVSLTADVEKEAEAGLAILRALNLRSGARLTSCPTCGRCKVDMIPLAQRVYERLRSVDKDITVAVMGCAVNGPGEARHADVGLACGDGEALIFARGEILRKVPIDTAENELFYEIERL